MQPGHMDWRRGKSPKGSLEEFLRGSPIVEHRNYWSREQMTNFYRQGLGHVPPFFVFCRTPACIPYIGFDPAGPNRYAKGLPPARARLEKVAGVNLSVAYLYEGQLNVTRIVEMHGSKSQIAQMAQLVQGGALFGVWEWMTRCSCELRTTYCRGQRVWIEMIKNCDGHIINTS